jgi:hypothetical protein
MLHRLVGKWGGPKPNELNAPSTPQALLVYGSHIFLMRSHKLSMLLIRRTEFHSHVFLLTLWFSLCTMAIGRDERVVFVMFAGLHALVQSLDDASLRTGRGMSLLLSRLGFAMMGFAIFLTFTVLFLLGTVPNQSYVRVEFRPDLLVNGTIDPDAAHVWDLTQSVADVSLALTAAYLFTGLSVFASHSAASSSSVESEERLGAFASIRTPVVPVFERGGAT